MRIEKCSLSSFMQNLSISQPSNTVHKNQIAINDHALSWYDSKWRSARRGDIGPRTLKAGDESLGFFGEVPANEFIRGDILAESIGLNAGIPCYLDEPWLKCIIDSKIVFFPKRAIRHSLRWIDIYNAGAVTTYVDYDASRGVVTQDATVSIAGSLFKVRLFRGSVRDSASTSGAYDPAESHGSEFNRLIYRVSSTRPASQSLPNIAEYSEAEIGFGDEYYGRWTYCADTYSNMRHSSAYRLKRGGYGITSYFNVNAYSAEDAVSWNGWRPILELI